MKQAILFLFLWLMVGFSTGTSTLLGPVRWVVSFFRRSGWKPGAENAAVIAIILVLVCVSAGIAVVLTRLILGSSRGEVRFGLPAVALVATLGAVWLWMDPDRLRIDIGEETVAGSRFTFGPYPDEARLRRLKREGYTAVIPLLHPAVVPFEPVLLGKEREAAARVGIELIHVPMLPWVSENTSALEQIKNLAEGGAGRYYVHCYLGTDRVQLVRRIVEQAGSPAHIEALSAARSLEERRSFERGDIARLDDRVYLTPYPTDEEFVAFFLTGAVNQVVSLLDPDNPDDRPWIEKERAILFRYRVPLLNMPISNTDYDPGRVLEFAQTVRRLPRPVVVHAFLSASSGMSPAAEAFLQAYR
ncbi:MAG: hypothetical protein ACRD1Z_11800, partial [Vicinamibacteria bacterium]